jgi:PTS system nitrogen regulatory IIA component
MQLTVRDVASLLEIEEDEVYRCIREGSIPFYEINDQYRFNRAELLDWATASGRRVSAELIHTLAKGSPEGLAEALSFGGVQRELSARDYPSLVDALVDHLPIRAPSDRTFVKSVLSGRHPVQSTVGDGIAIPHVRTPIVLHGSRSAIALSFLSRPIDMSAVDGRAVNTIFLVVAPTPKTHLELLSRLSTALLDKGFRGTIIRRASDQEIIDEARRVDRSVSARAASRPKSDGSHG